MNGLYTFSGFIVGLIVGLSGVGGGSLMTPLLVLLFGISPATAVGTDLLYAALTKAGGSWAHARRNTVDWPVVRSLALGSIPASILTLWVLHQLHLSEHTLRTLVTHVLSIALILTAIAIFLKMWLKHHGRELVALQNRYSLSTRHRITVVAGLILGVLVSLSSVGAGALGVVLLMFLYPEMTTSRVVGTDIAHAVPLTLVAGLGHATLGTVDFYLLGSLLLGSLPGIWLGSHLCHRIPETFLRPLLAILLILIGGRLLWS